MYGFVKVTGGIPALLYLRPKVHYIGQKPNTKGAVMISSNHVDMIDPVLLLCVFWKRRLASLATKDLYKNAFMKWFLPRMHCIQVDKENFSMNAFHEVRDRLTRGEAVMIFPEGQVNGESSSFLAFKSGAVLMAHAGSARVLPVYIEKRKKWYHRSHVVIGEAIDVRSELGERPSMDELSGLNELIKEREERLKEYYHEKVHKGKKEVHA